MTSGGVVVGTTAVVLLIGLTNGLQQTAEASIGSGAAITQIDVYPGWNPDPTVPIPRLNDEAIRAMSQMEGVVAVIPTLRLQGGEIAADDYVKYGEILGIDPRYLPYLAVRTQSGEPLTLAAGQGIGGSQFGDNFYDPTAEEWAPITIDPLATPLKLRLYQVDGTIRRVNLALTALLEPTGGYSDMVLYLPLADVKSMNEALSGNDYTDETFVYDQVTIQASSRETVSIVSAALREAGYSAGGMGEYLNSLNGFFSTMRLMLGGVGGVALVVAAFGVANTMMMAILERTREIGIMKAIGATNQEILTLFLMEAGLVGGLGGVVGVVVARLLQDAINGAIQNTPQDGGGISFLPFDASQIGGNLIIVPDELIVFALILATLVGALAGMYPAWRAAQLPPVQALKLE